MKPVIFESTPRPTGKIDHFFEAWNSAMADAARLDKALVPFRGRAVDRLKPVAVYRNLRAQTPEERWSIVQGRHVVAHAAAVMLKDVTFKVSAVGVERSRRLGHRVVCAYAVGLLTGSGMGITATEGRDLPMKVTFDIEAGAFVAKGSRRVQKGAAVALFNERGCSTAYST